MDNSFTIIISKYILELFSGLDIYIFNNQSPYKQLYPNTGSKLIIKNIPDERDKFCELDIYLTGNYISKSTTGIIIQLNSCIVCIITTDPTMPNHSNLQILDLLIENNNLKKDLDTTSGVAQQHFLANISHEIRTPLNSIIGYTQLLKQTNLNISQLNFLNTLNKCSVHLLQIVNDILDFSRLSFGQVLLNECDFSINEIIEMIRDAMGYKLYEKSQILDFSINHNFPKNLIADKSKIIQIIINLVSNAIKYTHECGHISVSFSLEDIVLDSAMLVCSVIDNGIGINEKDISKIFHSFIRANKTKNGTGLGLYICKKLCELMDGDISVVSKLGFGSTFTFKIKIKLYRDIPNTELHVDLSIFENRHILLVDNNETNNIMDIFTKIGFIPILCNTVLEACKMFMIQKYPFIMGIINISNIPPHEAIELAKMIKNENPDFYLLSIADNISNEDIFDNHITLPIEYNKFVRLLYTVVSESIKTTTSKNCLKGTNHTNNTNNTNNTNSLSTISHNQWTILIAEDVEYNAKMLSSVLENIGYTKTIIFKNGLELIDYFTTKTNIDKHILILDLIMPEKDGFDVLNYIKTTTSIRIPVIILTASVSEDIKIRCEKFGIQYFMNKPIQLKELRKILNQITNM
jgi:signal transduction histidine kinase/CheY-like chemotaxis protein